MKRKIWTQEELIKLEEMCKNNMSYDEIENKLTQNNIKEITEEELKHMISEVN